MGCLAILSEILGVQGAEDMIALGKEVQPFHGNGIIQVINLFVKINMWPKE